MLLRHSFMLYSHHSFRLLVLNIQLVSFITSVIQHIHESDLIQLLMYAHSPCYTPYFYLLGPSRCDRIVHLGPRLSVNCSPLFPIVPLCPPLQNPNTFSDFPEPKCASNYGASQPPSQYPEQLKVSHRKLWEHFTSTSSTSSSLFCNPGGHFD
jgi:hypothetical protein